MGYMSRKPNSNDPPQASSGKSPYLEETEVMDETALLLAGQANRCKTCRKAVRNKHLKDGLCPECR